MLQIQFFGCLQLTLNGEYISGLTRPRGKSLLAYLLLHHETPQNRAHLAYTFWPDSTDKQARTNLRRELHQLRQVHPLFDESLTSDTQTIQWVMPFNAVVDVAEFEQLLNKAPATVGVAIDSAAIQATYQQAIDLYHGEFLPGLYDEWIIAKREAFQQQFIHALELLTQLLTVDRDYAAAISLIQRLLQHDPLYEAGYLQLMELYALQNDRARALHAYHSCASVLERELGVPPSAEIEAAYQRILQADEESASQRTAATSTSTALVGRKNEWQTLLSEWRQTSRGRTFMVLIEGEAGIGKSRLAEELLEWVNRQGMETARTRSYAAEGSLAYAPVIEWLRSKALRATLRNLDDVWLTEIARLLPELLVERPDLSAPEPMTERRQRQRLFEALARVFTASSQPCLLLIDDLQWCDQESMEWLRFLLHFLPTTPLMIVGTARSEEIDPDHPLHNLIRELLSHTQLTQIELESLTAGETAELALQELGSNLDTDATERVFQESEGNPLFVVEMVRAGSFRANSLTEDANANTIEIPPKVYTVIQHRLSQLSPIARSLASLAATIGRSFSYEVLVAASDRSEDEVVNGLDELWQRRVIREQEGMDYDFGHDRIREAAYAELSPVRKKRVHWAIATALEVVYQDSLDAVSGQLAYHFSSADFHQRAVHWYQQAGEVASARSAYRESIEYYSNALAQYKHLSSVEQSVDQKIILLVNLKESIGAVHGFAIKEIEVIVLQIEELLDEINSTQVRFKAVGALRGFYAAGNRLDIAYQHIQIQLGLLEEMNNPILHMGLHQAGGLTNLQLGRFREAQDHFESAGQCFKEYQFIEPKKAAHKYSAILAKWAIILWIRGYPEQAHAKAEEGRILSNSISDIHARHVVLYMHSLYYRYIDETQVLSELGSGLEKIGNLYDIPYAIFAAAAVQGYILTIHGSYDRGIPLLRQSIDGYKSRRHTMLQPLRFGFLINAQFKAGRFDDALATIEEAFAMSEYSGQPTWDAEHYRLRGESLLALGAPLVEVENCYQKALAIAEEQSAKMLSLRATMSICRLRKEQGRGEEARPMLQEAYDWFTEGFDSAELVEARALLDSLSP